MSATEAVVVADRLGRWYGQVSGLTELTARIRPGITGLVGPNGAGKSTLLKLIAGEIRPSRGTIEVLGMRPFANRALLRRIGFCPQQDALYDHMSGLGFVELLLRLHGFAKREARSRAQAAIERVGLADAAHRRTGEYSRGMRQRIKLAQSFAHGPELLVVDEPLTGLDPIARLETNALLRELGEAGTHVVISSHVLHEVESLTEEMLLLHRGRLLAQGSVRDVRRLLNRHPRRVEVRARDARRLAGRLVELGGVTSLRIDDAEGRLWVEAANLDSFLRSLTRIAADERVGVAELDSPDAGLEAVFDYLVD